MSDNHEKVMVQFRFDGEVPPDRGAVAARFSIPLAAIDPEFGVIVTDEAARLATVLVPAHLAQAIDPQFRTGDPAEGSFSNPLIAPFGPPDADEGSVEDH